MADVSLKLREIILNTRRPIVLRDFKPNWKCYQGSLVDWCRLFDEICPKANFEQMDITVKRGSSQFLPKRDVAMTMKEFLELHKEKKQKFWSGMNYKMASMFPEPITEGIDFSVFGFPHVFERYSLFWLSSESYHTPCHQDTYGCNVVVQVYGSKRWVLFPPKTPLTSTRLPYEESSIYCIENFFAPAPEELYGLGRFEDDAFICELKPGDVLIVPRHWWHFAETTELSLSINSWIPLDVDKDVRLEECIVKYLIEALTRIDEFSCTSRFLTDAIDEENEPRSILEILTKLAEDFGSDPEADKSKNKIKERSYAYQYLEEKKVEDLLKEFPNASFIENVSSSEYRQLLEHNAKRFQNSGEFVKFPPRVNVKQTFINSVCSPTVVQSIAREFKRRYPEKTLSYLEIEKD